MMLLLIENYQNNNDQQFVPTRKYINRKRKIHSAFKCIDVLSLESMP